MVVWKGCRGACGKVEAWTLGELVWAGEQNECADHYSGVGHALGPSSEKRIALGPSTAFAGWADTRAGQTGSNLSCSRS